MHKPGSTPAADLPHKQADQSLSPNSGVVAFTNGDDKVLNPASLAVKSNAALRSLLPGNAVSVKVADSLFFTPRNQGTQPQALGYAPQPYTDTPFLAAHPKSEAPYPSAHATCSIHDGSQGHAQLAACTPTQSAFTEYGASPSSLYSSYTMQGNGGQPIRTAPAVSTELGGLQSQLPPGFGSHALPANPALALQSTVPAGMVPGYSNTPSAAQATALPATGLAVGPWPPGTAVALPVYAGADGAASMYGQAFATAKGSPIGYTYANVPQQACVPGGVPWAPSSMNTAAAMQQPVVVLDPSTGYTTVTGTGSSMPTAQQMRAGAALLQQQAMAMESGQQALSQALLASAILPKQEVAQAGSGKLVPPSLAPATLPLQSRSPQPPLTIAEVVQPPAGDADALQPLPAPSSPPHQSITQPGPQDKSFQVTACNSSDISADDSPVHPPIPMASPFTTLAAAKVTPQPSSAFFPAANAAGESAEYNTPKHRTSNSGASHMSQADVTAHTVPQVAGGLPFGVVPMKSAGTALPPMPAHGAPSILPAGAGIMGAMAAPGATLTPLGPAGLQPATVMAQAPMVASVYPSYVPSVATTLTGSGSAASSLSAQAAAGRTSLGFPRQWPVTGPTAAATPGLEPLASPLPPQLSSASTLSNNSTWSLGPSASVQASALPPPAAASSASLFSQPGKVKVLLCSGGHFTKCCATQVWEYTGGETRLVRIDKAFTYPSLVSNLTRASSSISLPAAHPLGSGDTGSRTPVGSSLHSDPNDLEQALSEKLSLDDSAKEDSVVAAAEHEQPPASNIQNSASFDLTADHPASGQELFNQKPSSNPSATGMGKGSMSSGKTQCPSHGFVEPALLQLKYELPGEPSVLIDLVNDEDVENMWEVWEEYCQTNKPNFKLKIYLQQTNSFDDSSRSSADGSAQPSRKGRQSGENARSCGSSHKEVVTARHVRFASPGSPKQHSPAAGPTLVEPAKTRLEGVVPSSPHLPLSELESRLEILTPDDLQHGDLAFHAPTKAMYTWQMGTGAPIGQKLGGPQVIKFLGAGAYGEVYLCRWHSVEVAVKCLNPSLISAAMESAAASGSSCGGLGEQAVQELLKEAAMLAGLRHPNVVWVYGVLLPPDIQSLKHERDRLAALGTTAAGEDIDAVHLAAEAAISSPMVPGQVRPPGLVTEYLSGGNLRTALSKNCDFIRSELARVKLALDAARGMEYLHSKKMVHFDLKTGNLLVGWRERSPCCKVADFGLAKQRLTTYVTGVTSLRGTLPWTAPEIIRTPKAVTQAVDVYSFGIVLWEMWTGREPFEGINYHALLHQIAAQENVRPTLPGCPDWEGPVPDELAPGWKDLMTECWAEDPQDRPPFSAIVKRLEVMLAQLKAKKRAATTASGNMAEQRAASVP